MGFLWRSAALRWTMIVAVAAGQMAVSATAQADFGVQPGSFELALRDSFGEAASLPQAGGHPFAVNIAFAFDVADHGSGLVPEGEVKTFATELPTGLVGNPEAVAQCSQSDFPPTGPVGYSRCPTAAQVGVANLALSQEPGSELGHQKVPIYNLTPPRGVFARYGFVAGVPITIDVRPRSESGYATTVTARNLPQTFLVFGAALTLWGVPADSAHDSERFLSGAQLPGDASGDPLPSGLPRIPFITNPTRCGVPLPVGLQVDSWQQPGNFLSYLSSPLTFGGCNQLRFEPSIEARPTTDIGDAPSGLDFDLHIPQNQDVEGHEDPDGVASAQTRNVTVRLPEGMTVNPAAAGLLEGCSPAQVGISLAGVPDDSPVACPDASKLGVAKAVSPVVGHPLPGSVYLATPRDNPLGSPFALYLVIEDPISGLLVKLAGRVEPDPRSGRLTVSFEDAPQLPLEDLSLHVFEGASAVLRTPPACGGYTTTAALTPWSSPEGPVATPSGPFRLSRGPGGGSCAEAGAAAPNDPAFVAGAVNPTAGAFSPLVLKLARSDGSQPFGSVDATLPNGLLGRLTGIAPCPETSLTAAANREGRAEQVSPSCAASSQVGSVAIGAGAGPAPLYLAGKAYLAGPYKGAPLSLAIVAPALAGPFDLGTVVVRMALQVDPVSAQVHVESDPFPAILQGVPLDVRSIALTLDRQRFIRTPTSCEPTAVTGTSTSELGDRAPLSQRFQVDDCGGLSFEPRLSLSFRGALGRNGHPALRAVIRARAREASIASVAVTLPAAELLDLRHLRALCPRQLPPDGCPRSSRLGTARVWSPLLAAPLRGPVYLRTPSGRLPDLLADLRGDGLRFLLPGRTTGRGGRLGLRLPAVPDVPLAKAILTLGGAGSSIFVNSEALCARPRRGAARLSAHNGMQRELRPLFRLRGTC
jgi:hypothetical protein